MQPTTITSAQLERLLPLAHRAHDGSLQVESVERNGLSWLRINVLLTDMGDKPPLHTFYMGPRGNIKP